MWERNHCLVVAVGTFRLEKEKIPIKRRELNDKI